MSSVSDIGGSASPGRDGPGKGQPSDRPAGKRDGTVSVPADAVQWADYAERERLVCGVVPADRVRMGSARVKARLADPEGALAYDAKQVRLAAALRKKRQQGRLVELDSAGNAIAWGGRLIRVVNAMSPFGEGLL